MSRVLVPCPCLLFDCCVVIVCEIMYTLTLTLHQWLVIELMVCMFSPNTWYPQCQVTSNPTFLMNIQLKNSAKCTQNLTYPELDVPRTLRSWTCHFEFSDQTAPNYWPTTIYGPYILVFHANQTCWTKGLEVPRT